MDGTAIDTDWTGTLATGSVVLTELNTDVAAEGTQDAIDAAMAKLENGELHVFDTSTFTVNGEALSSYMADVDTDADYTAPYFDLEIDGITRLDTAF